MNYVLSLLPIALYLLLLRAFDSFSLAKWKVLLACIGYGVQSCLMAFALTRAVEIPGWAVPALEEVLKGAAVLFLVYGGKIRFLHEALIYGAAAGSGFALAENLLYLYFQPGMMAGTAMVRGAGCAILHIGCTALVGTLLLLLKKGRMSFPAGAVISFIPSILIHLGYNLAQADNLADPLLLMSAAIVLFISILVILFSFGEKRIYRWMDHSLSIDVQTLSAIKAGNFTSTNAGKYLIDIQDRFKPECFFDMICYVQLSLELKIEKQSYMLLCQTGFDALATGKTYEEHRDKKLELDALRKRIGKTGMSVLAPLVA